MLTNDPSKKLNRMTSTDTSNAISSRASRGGRSRSNSQDGNQLSLFGQEAAPVSRSAKPASERALTTSATCGRNSAVSLRSAALQLALESRLRARVDVNGSPEYVLTWKHWDMRSGPPICALRARQRRIPASDSGGLLKGLATATAHDCGHGGGRSEESAKKRSSRCLQREARLVGWASPAATTWGGTPEQHLERKRKAIAAGKSMGLVVSCLDQQVMLVGWVTPTARDHSRGGKPARPWDTGVPLSQQVVMIGWSTPQNADGRGATGPASKNKDLGRDALLLSSAMEVSGVLNPAHSRWLQGFPDSWDEAAPGASDFQSVQQELTGCVV